MNRETRRLSKIPEQVKAEVRPFYIKKFAIPTAQIDSEKIEKLNDETAQIITSGLAVRQIMHIYSPKKKMFHI